MTEEWMTIPGLGSKYQISNLGRVKSLSFDQRYYHWRLKETRMRRTKEKILAQQTINSGYRIVHLWHDDKRVALTVHRLVAGAFCPGFFEGADVNHLDGDKENNNWRNLQWISRSDNHYHAVALRLKKDAVRVTDPLTGAEYHSIAQAARALRKNHRTVSRDFLRTDELEAACLR